MTIHTNKGAKFSDCGKYRYALWRIWDRTKPLVMFIGVNPSTANAEADDPTIQSVTRISEHNGYGGFYMMNLFGIISSDPAILKSNEVDPMGENLRYISIVNRWCKDVVFAWGTFKEAKQVCQEFIDAYPNALCIYQTKDGSPTHPLFKKGTSVLQPFIKQ